MVFGQATEQCIRLFYNIEYLAIGFFGIIGPDNLAAASLEIGFKLWQKFVQVLHHLPLYYVALAFGRFEVDKF